MNIAEFSLSATFQGAIQTRVATYGVDLATYHYRGPTRRLMTDIAADILRKQYHDLSMAEIMGHTKTMKLVLARGHIWYAITIERPDVTLSGIGRAFNRHHSTVMNGIARHKKLAGIS